MWPLQRTGSTSSSPRAPQVVTFSDAGLLPGRHALLLGSRGTRWCPLLDRCLLAICPGQAPPSMVSTCSADTCSITLGHCAPSSWNISQPASLNAAEGVMVPSLASLIAPCLCRGAQGDPVDARDPSTGWPGRAHPARCAPWGRAGLAQQPGLDDGALAALCCPAERCHHRRL